MFYLTDSYSHIMTDRGVEIQEHFDTLTKEMLEVFAKKHLGHCKMDSALFSQVL